MSLDDREHVEAVAIIRALVQATPTEHLGDVHRAAVQWLEENHPSPAEYMSVFGCSTVAVVESAKWINKHADPEEEPKS